MNLALKSTIAAIALAAASPAFAVTNPATCTASTATSVSGGIAADACVGYYSGNLLNSSPTDLQNQTDALSALLGTPTTVDNALFNTLISGSLSEIGRAHA